MTERTLYLVVLSGREGKQTEDAEYWLQLIRSFGGKSEVIVVLNKVALHPFDVNRQFLQEKYPCIIEFAKTDCERPEGIEMLREVIVAAVDRMEHRKAKFPRDWFAIKERLAAMSERNEDFVTWEKYREICREFGEIDSDAQKQLAVYLHDLGIALNYREDPRLRDTHVLNPRWVTEGIYPLLRAGQAEKRQGVLELRDVSATLDGVRYPEEKHEFLLRLMEKFELCFALPNPNGQSQQWLVPELLGENQPDIREILEAPGLGFRFQYEVLPEGVLPRFIVQTHDLSKKLKDWRWRTGAVLEWNGCRAVVRADFRERRVDVHVTGAGMRRRELLAIVRAAFDAQHREMSGLNVDERVVVPGERAVTVSYRDLLQREDDGEIEFRPEGATQRVRVAELLNGVELAEVRAERREQGRESSRMSFPSAIIHGDLILGAKQMNDNKSTRITVLGDNHGQIGEVLNNCTNITQQQPNGEKKRLLESLEVDVEALMHKIPADKGELKEKTAENLKMLVEQAAAQKPSRHWYSVSAEGLIEASRFMKDFSGNIAGTVGQLGRLLWPDFTVGEEK